jgi:hypothetical protein
LQLIVLISSQTTSMQTQPQTAPPIGGQRNGVYSLI